MSIQQFPKPETTRAFLVSGGIQKPTATVHHYHETRAIAGSTTDFEFVFKCFRTGAERIWGSYSTLNADEAPELN